MPSFPDYTKAITAIRHWLLAKEYYEALRALAYARERHVGYRKDGLTPEFHHQLSVVYYLRTIHRDLINPQHAITVALLHDLREDYNVSLEELKQKFGDKVMNSVRLLTKDERPLSLYFHEMIEDPTASIVKAADRIHNHQSMVGVFDVDKQREYVEETRVYVLPMVKAAQRLYPEQDCAYENAKHILKVQIELVQAIHGWTFSE